MEPVNVETAETWVANEAVFVSDRSYDDPYRDVTMDLILTNGHVQYTIPCFWDGGRIWRARFVCPTAGTWTYTTICNNTEDTGLHNRESRFVCTTYAGDLDIYKHGFITANYNNATRQKYFTYADGTPFFYLGDTHWNFGAEPLTLVKNVVNKRVQQGFTVYQSQPNGATFTFEDGISASDIPRFETFDAKFQYIAQNGLVHANSQFFFPNTIDDLIYYFGQLYGNTGVTLTDTNGETITDADGNTITLYGIDTSKLLGTQAMYYGYIDENGSRQSRFYNVNLYDFTDEVKAELELASRYWVARYSAYPVMWTLGQEVDNDYMFGDNTNKVTVGFGHPVWGKANNPYKLVAEYIGEHDPYNSPLTAHQESASRFQENDERYAENGDFDDVFGAVESHTWYASQWKVQFDATSLAGIHTTPKNYWNNSDKVVINYESYYDMLQTKEFGARAQGWFSYLSGVYGYGWGGQGTWQYLGTYGDDWAGDYIPDGVDRIYREERIKANDWTKALNLNSAKQMGYMRNFFTQIVGDWHTLIPRFDDTAYLTRATGAQAVIASNADNSKIVAYFLNFSDTTVAEIPNASSAGTATGTVGNLDGNTTYSYIWYNPITGKITKFGTFTSSPSGTWTIGEKKTCDMVLYIYK